MPQTPKTPPVPQVPERNRTRLTTYARALRAPAWRVVARVGWRVLHPADRGPFVETPSARPTRVLGFRCADGWSGRCVGFGEAPGAGPPVMLLHGLGLGAAAWRYGAPSLVDACISAGLSPYILVHRGDAGALPPAGGGIGDFDDVLGQDVPTAIDRILEDSGARRVFLVGHGLGGQLALVHASRDVERVAGVVAVGAAVRFPRPRTEVTRWLRVARWLPDGLRLGSGLGALAPWVDADLAWTRRHEPGATSAARVRGLWMTGAPSVPAGLLRSVASFHEHGHLVDRTGSVDRTAALADARCPLLVVTSEDDDLCRPGQALAAVDAWGGAATSRRVDGLGHDDLLVGDAASGTVHGPVVAWLAERRDLAYSSTSSMPAASDGSADASRRAISG